MLRFLEKRKIHLVYTSLILYWIILLAATSFPTSSIPTMGAGDKVMHFAAYFGLGVLLNFTLIFQKKYPGLKKKNAAYTILIGTVYAIFDELHQHFIPGRSMEFLDFVADFFGLVLAIVFVLFLLRFNQFVPNKN